jgi:hypothetical protein
MDNNTYAINSILQKMKDDKRFRLFSLTNLILNHQNEYGFNLLNTTDEVSDILQNYSQITKEQYLELSHIYGEYHIFNKIKTLTTKSTFIKKINSTFEDFITDSDAKDEFKKLCNALALVNLLQKRLKGKTIEELNNYRLLNKLHEIDTQLTNFLAIEQLSSFTTDDQLASFSKEEYLTYDDINIPKLKVLVENNGQRIYDLIDLFQ